MKNISLFVLALCLGTGTLSAQKDVTMKVIHTFDGQPLVLNQDFTDWAGNTVKITRAACYLSGFELIHDGGQTMDLPNQYMLIQSNITDYDMGTLNLNALEAINYDLGVDSANNHADPAQWPASHPLALQSPSMHWGWSSGYRFLAIEGEVDADNNNTTETMFQFHAVGNEYLTPVSVTTTGDMNGNDLTIFVVVDWSGWLQNVDLTTAGAVHGGGPIIDAVIGNTNPEVVFSEPLTLSTYELAESTNSVYTDYTYGFAPALNYQLASDKVSLIITDLNGRIVRSEENMAGDGRYEIGEGLASGIYVCTFFANDQALISEKISVTK